MSNDIFVVLFAFLHHTTLTNVTPFKSCPDPRRPTLRPRSLVASFSNPSSSRHQRRATFKALDSVDRDNCMDAIRRVLASGKHAEELGSNGGEDGGIDAIRDDGVYAEENTAHGSPADGGGTSVDPANPTDPASTATTAITAAPTAAETSTTAADTEGFEVCMSYIRPGVDAARENASVYLSLPEGRRKQTCLKRRSCLFFFLRAVSTCCLP